MSWIDAKKILPDDDVKVLALGNGDKIATASYSSVDKEWTYQPIQSGAEDPTFFDVTHWTPLPMTLIESEESWENIRMWENFEKDIYDEEEK